jgi:hypothetical protein
MSLLEAPKLKGWLDGLGGNSKRQTRWLTPPSIVEALGIFDLDPCGAPGHILAANTYLEEDGQDGLTLPWSGRVWLNPPYGKEAEAFLRRLADHGSGTALIFARTETRVFVEQVWGRATAILFIKGCLTFIDASGAKAVANSGAPSCLVAYGAEDARLLAASSIQGHFVVIGHSSREAVAA